MEIEYVILTANVFNLVAPTRYHPGDDSNGNSSIFNGGSNKTQPSVYSPLNITIEFLYFGELASGGDMNLALKCYRCRKKNKCLATNTIGTVSEVLEDGSSILNYKENCR